MKEEQTHGQMWPKRMVVEGMRGELATNATCDRKQKQDQEKEAEKEKEKKKRKKDWMASETYVGEPELEWIHELEVLTCPILAAV